MNSLKHYINESYNNQTAVGHFNVSNLEGVWGIFRSAEKLKVPVIIGVSEGERDFFGVNQIRKVIDSLQAEFNYPIFLNADHTYSKERVKEVVEAGFDSVTIDGSKLSFEDNVSFTKDCVDLVKKIRPEMLVEGEIGYIGTSSKLLDDIPDDVSLEAGLTTVKEAKTFVSATGVELLSPAVGSMHGMLKNARPLKLNIDLIRQISEEVKIPLVLHGGSGISADDFRQAIKAGVVVVHINTELRLAYRDALKLYLQENPDEIAPYRFLKPGVMAVEEVTTKWLKVFNNLN